MSKVSNQKETTKAAVKEALSDLGLAGGGQAGGAPEQAMQQQVAELGKLVMAALEMLAQLDAKISGGSPQGAQGQGPQRPQATRQPQGLDGQEGAGVAYSAHGRALQARGVAVYENADYQPWKDGGKGSTY